MAFDQTINNGPYAAGAFGQPQFAGGYNFNGQQPPRARELNVLTPEEIKQLQQNANEFVLALTHRESMQAKCNHRAADGMSDSLLYDPTTGIARCTICGYEFEPLDPDTAESEIQEAVDKVTNIIHTIKIMYSELPNEVAAEYFQILPLVMKLPQLFKLAVKCFNRHEANNWSYNNYSTGAIAMLNNLSNMFGGFMGLGPAGFNNQFQQPQGMYAGYPNQAYAGYPNAAYQQQPMMGQPMPGQPMMQPQGYQPQTQGYQFTPNQPQPAPAPAPQVSAPVAPQQATGDGQPQTTVTQQVNV